MFADDKVAGRDKQLRDRMGGRGEGQKARERGGGFVVQE